MRPIVEITEKIEGERLVTVSAVEPLMHKLLIKYLNVTAEDPHVKKEIKNAVKKTLKTTTKTHMLKKC